MDISSPPIIIETLGSLYPILPQSTGRYDVIKRTQRQPILVESAMFSSLCDDSPTYLPPRWCSTVHPEGKVYYYTVDHPRTVTEGNLCDKATAENITAWASHVHKRAADAGITLTEGMELFLQLDGIDCNYYFADHAAHTIFWLSSDASDDLGLSPVVSRSHMKLQLQAQYWTHVENFCNHIGGVSAACIDELIQIFAHGLADNLTSSLSTFPYDAATTEKFLNLLTSSRSRIREGYTVAFVARLWGLIMYNRYETQFGQEQARLSRDTAIFVESTNEVQWTKVPASILTFRISDSFNNRFNLLFVDQLVYGNDWSSFMKSCMSSWQHSSIASAALILLHIFCFFLPVSPALAYLSATLASLSILLSIFLIQRHEELANDAAVAAHDFLSAMISPSFKFQHIAFAFSLPRALFLHALIAFFSQLIVVLCQFVSLLQAAFFVFIVSSVLFSVHAATSRTQLRPRHFSLFKVHSEKAPESAV